MEKDMNKHHLESNVGLNEWNNLAQKYSLTSNQIEQLKVYLELLLEWNKKFNLTAITNAKDALEHHFDDSLAIIKVIDFSSIKTVADVGTGGGFPGLPLEIIYPHLHTILIEVNNKKRSFLEYIVQTLNLENVNIYPFDWRTFLRTTEYDVDYFFARASLQPEELVRIFKPSCTYHKAQLVYWASTKWTPEKSVTRFVEKEIVYTLDSVHRKFVFFKQR